MSTLQMSLLAPLIEVEVNLISIMRRFTAHFLHHEEPSADHLLDHSVDVDPRRHRREKTASEAEPDVVIIPGSAQNPGGLRWPPPHPGRLHSPSSKLFDIK